MAINFSLVHITTEGTPERKEIKRAHLDSQSLEVKKGPDYGSTVTYINPELGKWGVKSIMVSGSGIISFTPSDLDKFKGLAESEFEPRISYKLIPRVPLKTEDVRTPYIAKPDTKASSARQRKDFYHIATSTRQYSGVKITGPENLELTITF